MKLTLVSSLVIALLTGNVAANVLLEARSACNADNCARAVTGTKATPSASIRSADCSSFLRTTVSAITDGVTVTTIPTSVPTYASACKVGTATTSDAARYSSACSCFGIAASTATALTSLDCFDGETVGADCNSDCVYNEKCNYGVVSTGEFDRFLIDEIVSTTRAGCAGYCSMTNGVCGAAVFDPVSKSCSLYTARGIKVVPDAGVIALVPQEGPCSC